MTDIRKEIVEIEKQISCFDKLCKPDVKEILKSVGLGILLTASIIVSVCCLI